MKYSEVKGREKELYTEKSVVYLSKLENRLDTMPVRRKRERRSEQMGSIYKRGKIYWIKYYRQGKPYRESTHSKKESEAKRFLKKCEGEIAQGKIPGVHFDKIRFDELAQDFIADYRINQKKSLVRAEISLKHLKQDFEGARVTDINTPRIQAYIKKRLADGVKNATVNRELAALKRLLNLGAQQTPPKVDRVPYIPRLKEYNVRKGFFEHSDFLKLRDALPEYLKGFVTFAYRVGWRFTEISKLTWSQVDINQGIVRLEVGETKNDEGRTVYLDDELKQVFEEQHARKMKTGIITPYVFTSMAGDTRIKEVRYFWTIACIKVGLFFIDEHGNKIPTRTPHDFRRTAIRNMIRAGIPERVAMMISGHRTRCVFDRYNIVSDGDLQLAASKQDAYLKIQTDTIMGTVHAFEQKAKLKNSLYD